MKTRELKEGGASPSPSEQAVEAIYTAMAEEYVTLNDEAVREAAAEEGERLAATASHVRQLLLGEVKKFRQQRLQEALVAYERQSELSRELSRQRLALAQRENLSGEGRAQKAAQGRELLISLFARFDQAPLTLQHRDFKTLSDQDVESLLEQLAALGVLPKEG